MLLENKALNRKSKTIIFLSVRVMLMLQFSAADSVRLVENRADRQTDGHTHTTRLPYAVAPPLGITSTTLVNNITVNYAICMSIFIQQHTLVILVAGF